MAVGSRQKGKGRGPFFTAYCPLPAAYPPFPSCLRAFVVILFSSTGLALAAKPAAAPILPVVTAAPMAALPGATTEVMFSGEGLGKPVGLWTSFPAEVGAEQLGPGKLAYRLKVPAEAQVGIGAVRLVTSSGSSSLTFFMIDDLPTLPRQPGKHESADAWSIPEAGAVEGACEALASDFYVIEGKRGRRLSVEVVANRLGSKLDPTIRLRSSDGRELAYCDDFPGLGADCMLAHTFDADGKYLLEVRDANCQGGSQYFYRLRIGDFPLVTCAFPVAGKRGIEAAKFTFEGAGGARIENIAMNIAEELSRVPVGVRYPGGMGSGFASVLGADAPDFVAAEPNHQPHSAASISLPTAISGRLSVPGQKDYYTFEAKRGDRIFVRSQTRSIGSACELDIAVTDARGKKLPEVKPPTDAKKAAADATTTPPFLNEPSADIDIPADGQYCIVARDLGNTGGTGMVYRLTVEHGPDFSLAAAADKLDVPSGGSARIKITCVRRDFNGRIRLSLHDARGWTAAEAFIESGRTEGEIEVKASDPAIPNPTMNLQIVGTATIDGAERRHVASTAAAMQKVYPRMRFLPLDLDGLIGVGTVSKN